MDRSIELVPLVCVKCSTPIPAEVEQVAWVCAQCGQGNLLDQEKGPRAVDVSYSAAIAPQSVGKPFWVAEGRVSMSRQNYGHSGQQREAEAFWGQRRVFYVPAYPATLESLLSQAGSLLLNPPTLNPGPPAQFEPVTLQLEDVKAAAEFIVVAIEAGRKDKLKRVDFRLELSDPILWILP
jgi:predicted RNA-binding Zn-ribbon protein involved in translation (DUF1610 family)